ncbi:MAG: transcriptional regulator [Myxococcota bacterium]
MYRKDLIDRLTGASVPVSTLARELEVPTKELAEHLGHIQKSLEHDPRDLVVTPAECRKCHFRFGEDKLRKPGRCPSCKSTWIREPSVGVRER